MPSKDRKNFVTRIFKSTSTGTSSAKSQDRITVSPPKYLQILATLFFVIWILIGLFFLVFIYGNLRQGAFRGLFSSKQAQQQSSAASVPQETTIPGIGKVNISCVQNSLSSETIQKIVQTGNTSTLTDDEKAKLAPCIVAAEQATPSASP